MRHKIIELEDIKIGMIEAGPRDGSAMMFLHGWPQTSRAFESVMNLLSADFHVVAIDLPGVGRSTGHSRGDKRTVAGHFHTVIQAAGLTNVTLVGHDVGGQIVYAYLHEFPKTVTQAAILNVAVPGIDPWSEVLRNPYIWHFAFHPIANCRKHWWLGIRRSISNSSMMRWRPLSGNSRPRDRLTVFTRGP